MVQRANLLITGSHSGVRFERVLPFAKIHWLEDLSDDELEHLLPSVECLYVQSWWPETLTPSRISRMKRLRFIQSGWAGVNHIPFRRLRPRVIVSSNAGGFSEGVAEFALALALTAVKRVVKLDHSLRSGEFKPSGLTTLVKEIPQVRGMTLGVLGYGGIGRRIGSMGHALGMKVVAFSRHSGHDGDARVFEGRKGLLAVLEMSNIAVIALPLSNLTVGLIGSLELARMRRDAILVNVARAEIVQEAAMYDHLVKYPRFTYATDVWQLSKGKETYASKFPFLELWNFIGTPHVAGGSTSTTGEPGKLAFDNILRYFKGEPPRNVVDPSEYV